MFASDARVAWEFALAVLVFVAGTRSEGEMAINKGFKVSPGIDSISLDH